MEKMVQRSVRDELMFRMKLAVLGDAHECGNDTKAWREIEVPKSTFYPWKKAYEREGMAGLKRKKPYPILNLNVSNHRWLKSFFRSGDLINWVLRTSRGT